MPESQGTRDATHFMSQLFFFFFLYNIHAGLTLQMARDTRLNTSRVPGMFFIILLLNMESSGIWTMWGSVKYCI